MTLIVIDTNVLVSAFKNPVGNEAAVLRSVRARAFVPCLSPEIIGEYRRVMLRAAFGFPADAVADALSLIQRLGMLVATPPPVDLSPDPDDNAFIACAIAAEADFIVTGNRRHFPQARYGTAEVVNARELLARQPPPA